MQSDALSGVRKMTDRKASSLAQSYCLKLGLLSVKITPLLCDVFLQGRLYVIKAVNHEKRK